MKNNNEEYEVVGINHKEYHKQMEEQAIKSKKYIAFKTVVGGDMDNPVSSLQIGNATALQMIQIMCVLKHTLEELIKEYPELYAEALQTDVNATFWQSDKNNIDETK